MIWQLAYGAVVSLVNFGIHAFITGLIIVVTRHTARVTGEMGMFVRMASLMFVTMTALMVAHVIEIGVWAGHYAWIGLELKNATHFEFAFENYTALGYGDATPAEYWRLTGPITALNGLLLVGWSVAVIFEVMRMAEVKFSHIPRRPTRRK
jgi:Ion channel